MQPTLDALFEVVGGKNNLPPRTRWVTRGRQQDSYMSPEELLDLDKNARAEYGMTLNEAKIRREDNSAKKFYYANRYGLGKHDNDSYLYLSDSNSDSDSDSDFREEAGCEA
jgi:hypothetical protein